MSCSLELVDKARLPANNPMYAKKNAHIKRIRDYTVNMAFQPYLLYSLAGYNAGGSRVDTNQAHFQDAEGSPKYIFFKENNMRSKRMSIQLHTKYIDFSVT